MPASRQGINSKKWPAPRLRPGMTHYQGVVRAMWRSMLNVLTMHAKPLDANFTVSDADLGAVGFLRDSAGSLKFARAIDTGPGNWANYPSLLIVVARSSSDATSHVVAVPHGIVEFNSAHGVTPGSLGYLSSITTGGITDDPNDAHTPATPWKLGIYLDDKKFLFNPERPV